MEKLKLIIIEDDAIIGLDLKRRLKRMGIGQVDMFSDARKALHHLRDHECGLVLMDIRLPGEMDGIDAAAIIRKRYGSPVVFVTGYADEETLNRARIAEPMGYILKPFKEHEIYATITIAVYKSQMETELRHQQEMQSSILNHIQDAIITTDDEINIRYMNPKAMHMLSADEFTAENRLSTYSDELSDFCNRLAGQEMDHTQTWENHLLNINENLLIVNLSISRLILSAKEHHDRGFLIVIHDNTQLKTMEAQVEFHETHDRLTGLMNRSEFQKQLELELSNAWEDRNQRSLVYLDINQFTLLNELQGHLAGDELLKFIARQLQVSFPNAQAISRLGDDEFAVILTGERHSGNEVLVQEFLKHINYSKFSFQGEQFPFSLTAGMTHFSREVLNYHILLSIAIDANILAKQEGGDHFRLLSLEDEVFLKRRGEMKWISVLTEALESNRFVLYFQPIVPIRSDQGLGHKAEILIRLLDDQGQIIPPGQFIPAAERYNLMHLIDRWVIRTLLRNFDEAVQTVAVENPVFCINLSGASMLNSDLKRFIIEEITENEIDPHHICLEVTETAAISNMTNATELIRELREFGCQFALDDFGNGFSNFNYLRYLEVDFLKIDGSFVRNMHEDPISKAMVEAIHRLGNAVNIRTIAEFVGNEEILAQLQDIGVDYAQGFVLAKPGPLLKTNGKNSVVMATGN
jgi:diguanylate cyclase (GGDEF)-like protein